MMFLLRSRRDSELDSTYSLPKGGEVDYGSKRVVGVDFTTGITACPVGNSLSGMCVSSSRYR